MQLSKWGAERLLSYYLGIDDWGGQEWDEKKYNPIITEVLEDCIKTRKLKIPEKYPELAHLFSCFISFFSLLGAGSGEKLTQHDLIKVLI